MVHSYVRIVYDLECPINQGKSTLTRIFTIFLVAVDLAGFTALSFIQVSY